MRDQHRPKQDLINEVVALRKQVADLREEMAARRRVEEALRHADAQLRALVDGAPAGLCLFRPDGAPITASAPFARMLGYESPAELLSVSQVVGVFESGVEQARLIRLVERGEEQVGEVLFRRRSGGPQAAWVMGATCKDPDCLTLVALENHRALDRRGSHQQQRSGPGGRGG